MSNDKYDLIYSDKCVTFKNMFDDHITSGYATFDFKDEFIIATKNNLFVKIIYDIELRLSTRTPNHDYKIKCLETNIPQKDLSEFIYEVCYENKDVPYIIERVLEDGVWFKNK